MQKLPEFVSGNIFVRPNVGDKGDVVHGHKHNFDHTTIFFAGRFHVRAVTLAGVVIERDFEAPSHCLIKAGVEHELTFLEDGIFWCVYAHREPQGRITQTYTGWDKAYG